MTELSPRFHDESRAYAVSGEAAFGPGDMFYTRTDARGVILEANEIFLRVSGFSWDDVNGAPHRIVRHPDMPRGVFHLFWEWLKAGKSVVAYVKNRTKDGGHYWVLALAWPTDDGYLSVRIKPGTALFREVCDIYDGLLREEKAGLSPPESAERLCALLQQAGFRDYGSFMTTALSGELAARDEARGQEVPAVQRRFTEMHDTVRRVGTEAEELSEVIRAIRTVPINMRILASRLESAGGPISAISTNYGSMLDEMATWVREFMQGPGSTHHRILDAIEHGRFLVCSVALQREMAGTFGQVHSEEALPGEGRAAHARFQDKARRFEASVTDALKTVDKEVSHLGRSVFDMKRYVTGLSSTRMMCKIESAVLKGCGDTSLAGIVEQLDSGQKGIEERLSRFAQLNAVIQGNIGAIRSAG